MKTTFNLSVCHLLLMFNKQNNTINVTLVFSTISILVSMEKNNNEV
jgi:hypothetical protein